MHVTALFGWALRKTHEFEDYLVGSWCWYQLCITFPRMALNAWYKQDLTRQNVQGTTGSDTMMHFGSMHL